MKKLLLLILLSSIVHYSYAQTVENIRVEPEGENIKIHYRIGGSLEGDVYNVGLECSIDGGPRFQPKTVIGDVGKNIRGGKSYYTIVWDVFEDVEEVGNAEFFISVDRVGGTIQQPPQTGPFSEPSVQTEPVKAPVQERIRFFTYEYNYWCPLGFRSGRLGNWGYQVYIRIGEDDFEEYTGWFSVGPTKRIVDLPKYKLHGFLGVGLGYYMGVAEFDFEFGFSNVIVNRLVLDLGYSYWTGTSLGIGLAF